MARLALEDGLPDLTGLDHVPGREEGVRLLKVCGVGIGGHSGP
jgi:hypothetical protein